MSPTWPWWAGSARKGELFPPKEIRGKLRLKPHMKVIYRVKDGVEAIPSLEEVLKEPAVVTITVEELYEFRRELSKEEES